MRKNLTNIVLSGLLAGLITGCSKDPKQMGVEEILAIEKDHQTRITIEYLDGNGKVYRTNIHKSNTFKCNDIEINPKDFLTKSDPMPYGKFDAEAYKKYQLEH